LVCEVVRRPANAGAKTNRKNISLWQKAMAQIALVGRAAQGLGMGDIAKVYEAQRFDLCFFRPFRADLSMRKSSSFLPPLIAATSHLGLAPRPAQVSPEGLRYLGGTFFLSRRFHYLGQPFCRQPPQTSSTAFQFQHDAREAFRQPALVGP